MTAVSMRSTQPLIRRTCTSCSTKAASESREERFGAIQAGAEAARQSSRSEKGTSDS